MEFVIDKVEYAGRDTYIYATDEEGVSGACLMIYNKSISLQEEEKIIARVIFNKHKNKINKQVPIPADLTEGEVKTHSEGLTLDTVSLKLSDGRTIPHASKTIGIIGEINYF